MRKPKSSRRLKLTRAERTCETCLQNGEEQNVLGAGSSLPNVTYYYCPGCGKSKKFPRPQKIETAKLQREMETR